ncbi:integrase, catalytic region, zinc finger, CCHC-type containing protein [Tanacetum coccineum]
MGLLYPKDSGFELTAFLDADHAGCINTRKSTSGGIQFLASRAKKASKNHDPLTLIAHSNTSSSQSHASSSYSPQSYYVTRPSSVVDYDDEYQGELQGDYQEDKLTTSMMLLARAISQKFSSPTNNRLRISSNTRNQAVIHDGNASDESNQIVQRVSRTDSSPSKANVQCYNCNEKGHYARECQKLKVRDAKYFREQMLLDMKDEAGRNLNNEENDFMLDNSYGEESLEELTVAVMLMARLQPADDNAENVSSYDAKVVSEVNASFKVHEQVSHVKRKTIIQTTDDDQIDLSIIFDDPFVENNEKLKKKQKDLLQQELETCQDWVKTFEPKIIQCSKYKETCEELERELRTDKDTIERILKEKYKIQSDFYKIENEKITIQHETQLVKKAFKDQENRYLEDIVDLKEKLSSHDRIVYKMGQSIQTIHMLGKKTNKVYDSFLKDGLGYQNPERLKKAIAVQPKLYNGDLLHRVNLKIDSPDSEETLEDAKESRLKMRNKMVQINYGKLNAFYETFVPQQEFSSEQTYFSIPSTSNNGSESKDVPPELPTPKMPKEKILLQNEIDRLLEVSLTSEIRDYVLLSVEKQKNELLKEELEKSSSDSKDIQANLIKRIKILENDFKRSQAQSIDFELKLQHQKEKMSCDVSWKSKFSSLNDENVLLKTQVESVVQEREKLNLSFKSFLIQ